MGGKEGRGDRQASVDTSIHLFCSSTNPPTHSSFTYLQGLKVVLLVTRVLVQNEDIGPNPSNDKAQVEL